MWIFVLEAEISKLPFILLVLQSAELTSSAYALKYLAIILGTTAQSFSCTESQKIELKDLGDHLNLSL